MASQSQVLKSVLISACSRLLAKGKDAILNSGKRSGPESDAIETWKTLHRGQLFKEVQLPASFSFMIKYEDWESKTTSADRVVLTSHGSPGSHFHFKYITPQLMNGDENIRVVGMNWPEHGYSEVMDEGEFFYCQSTDERMEILTAFCQRLGIQRVDVALGHSFGCNSLIALAADKEFGHYCNSLVLINCGGLKPHKAIRPYSMFQWLADACYHPVFGGSVRLLAYLFGRFVWGVKLQSPSMTAINIATAAHLGFTQLPGRVEKLRCDPKTARVLFVYSEDDPRIEKESSEELARALGCPWPALSGVDSDILEKVREWWKDWKPGNENGISKNLAVNFGKGNGGHFLQKRQAEFLANCVKVMSSK